MNEQQKPKSKIKAWGILLGTFAFLWVFGVGIGPWLQERIPVFHEIVEVIIAQDIDSGAYFYTEIKGSYDGESYLRGALRQDKDHWGLTWPFIAGIVLCLTILAVGFRFLPNEINDPDNPLARLSDDHL